MSSWDRIEREHELVHRTVDPAFWREYLEDHPDVLHHLIADLYRATSSAKDRPNSLEDLWGLVAPKFSDKPFTQAIMEVLGDRSLRSVAQQMHIHHTSLMRLVNGERDIVIADRPDYSMTRLEAIARALRVHPSYFVEWRRLWIMSFIDHAIAEQPELSIGLYRKFAGHVDTRRRERTLTA